MPKRTIDDETPPRRSKAEVAAAQGLLMRAVMYSPKDFVAGTIAAAAVFAIIGNAIFLQSGRHPSPMFGTPSFSEAPTPMVSNPLPRPRPLEAVQPSERALDSRLFDAKPAETRTPQKPEPKAEIVKPEAVRPEPAKAEKTDTRHADPMANLIRNASVQRSAPQAAAASNVPRPPAPVPTRGDPLGDMISSARGR